MPRPTEGFRKNSAAATSRIGATHRRKATALMVVAHHVLVPGNEHGNDKERSCRDAVDDGAENQQTDGVGGEETDQGTSVDSHTEQGIERACAAEAPVETPTPLPSIPASRAEPEAARTGTARIPEPINPAANRNFAAGPTTAAVTAVLPKAEDATAYSRIRKREIGSSLDDHLGRSHDASRHLPLRLTYMRFSLAGEGPECVAVGDRLTGRLVRAGVREMFRSVS